ncbi:MAG: hypothetical protein Ct9H300mP8_05350 [Gammaproteobacteria bacterium]|nr:MAG: hypothetical protein Ct9H300mP8_05350 [Gammaproteobacteria bacterium]
MDRAADGFEYGALAEEFGEEPVRQKIGEMIKAAPRAPVQPHSSPNKPKEA